MDDFETMIGKALAEGKTPEDLVKQMTEGFKAALEQKNAAETKAKEANARDSVISGVNKTFWEHVNARRLNMADAVALTFLMTVNDTEFGKSLKTPDELNALFKHIKGMVESIEGTFKVSQKFDSLFTGLADALCPDRDEEKKASEDANKSKVTVKRISYPPKKEHVCKCTISDKDKIEEFLRSLR